MVSRVNKRLSLFAKRKREKVSDGNFSIFLHFRPLVITKVFIIRKLNQPEVPLPREHRLPPLPELEEGRRPEGHEAREGHGHAVVEQVGHLGEGGRKQEYNFRFMICSRVRQRDSHK